MGVRKMKTEVEILYKLVTLKKSRDAFADSSMEYFIIDNEIKELEWVMEG